MEVITLNNKDFLRNCSELINKANQKPDVVFGILNAGGYIIDAIKDQNEFESVQFKQIKLQRIGGLKNEKRIFKSLLKIMPYLILDKFRIFESIKARKSINELNLTELKDLKINFKLTSKKSIKTILIIDDAIDTGRTMFVIKNNVSKMFPDAKIKVAVITWTLENSIIQPDYYLFKNILIRFPWSKDYKGKDFEKKSFSS